MRLTPEERAELHAAMDTAGLEETVRASNWSIPPDYVLTDLHVRMKRCSLALVDHDTRRSVGRSVGRWEGGSVGEWGVLIGR